MIYKVSVTFHKDFIEINKDEIAVGIISEPQKGKANKELIEKISKHLKVPKSNVKIVSGEKSRKKLVEVI
ncbi:MAG TPA: DUF167 domain-containing protein [Nitrosopumilaceae archaeon]|nr:DUF167 domain-containing protein [Nitrosopumilaceae archaeon]